MMPVLYCSSRHPRAEDIAKAMAEGFRRHNVPFMTRPVWRGQVEGDIAIAYGWAHETVFTAYKAAGAHYAYWDLGYWNRHPDGGKRGGAREGHHRLAVDSWDTADTMGCGYPGDRLQATPVQLQPILPASRLAIRNTILVAGMSEKGAKTHGYAYRQWEGQIMSDIHALIVSSGLRVEFRDKPPRKSPKPVEPIAAVLQRCCLVVSHHSNVAVDALIAGVPSWCRKGVGTLWSAASLEEAVRRSVPVSSQARQQYLQDIAYAQWTPAEMRSGEAWDHIKRLIV